MSLTTFSALIQSKIGSIASLSVDALFMRDGINLVPVAHLSGGLLRQKKLATFCIEKKKEAKRRVTAAIGSAQLFRVHLVGLRNGRTDRRLTHGEVRWNSQISRVRCAGVHQALRAGRVAGRGPSPTGPSGSGQVESTWCKSGLGHSQDLRRTTKRSPAPRACLPPNV